MGKYPTNIDYSLRKNISKACTFCKSRKRKCDGEAPCGFCQKKNKTGACSYDIIDKRSLRYSYLKYDSNDQSYQSGDEDHYSQGDPSLLPGDLKLPSLSNSVEIFHTSNNGTNKPKNTFSEHVASVLGITREVTPNSPHQYPQQQLPPANFKISISPASYDYEDGYLDNSSGYFNHTGQSSPLSLLHFSRTLFKSLNFNEIYSLFIQDKYLPAHQKVSLDLSKSDFVQSVNHKLIISDVESSLINPTNTKILPLPPRNICDILVDLFLQNANQLIYVINDNFLKNNIVEEAYNKPNEMSPKKLCQLYLILAIGSIYLKSLQHSGTPSVYSSVPAEYSNLANGYFDSALLVYNTLIKDGNLWIVEMKALLFIYYQLINKKNVAWLNLSSAIKVSESLGLNRKISNDYVKNKNQIIHRRKLWRSIYILDRVISISLGKPLNINDEAWDDRSSLPIEDSIGNLRSVCENQLTKISILTGEIYQNIYLISKFKIDKIVELIKNLNTWANNLPIQLKAEQILKMNDDDYTNVYKKGRFDLLPLLLLHLFHLNAVILLSKPFFQFKLSQDIESFIKTMKNHKSTLTNVKKRDEEISIIRNLSNSCINSSVFIIKFCWYFVKNKLHPIKPYMLINTIFNASLVVSLVLLTDLLNLIKYKKRANDYNEDGNEEWDDLMETFKEHFKILDVSLIILKEYSVLDQLAMRYHEVLNGFNDSILKLFKTSIEIIDQSSTSSNDIELFERWLFDIKTTKDIELNDSIVYNHDINIRSYGNYEITNLIANEQVENKFNEELNLVKSFLSNLNNNEGDFFL